MKLTYVAYSPLDLQSANSIQTFNSCRALAAQLGNALTVMVPRFRAREDEPPFPVVKISRVPLNKLTRVLKSAVWGYLERSVYAWRVARYLGAQRADMIYTRDVICAYWLVHLNFPVIYEVHDLESQHPSKLKAAWLQGVLARADERALRGARAVVSLTQTFKDQLVARGWQPTARVFVIPDAFDEKIYFPRERETARRRLNVPDDALVIGYAGMTFAYRRLDLLLDALRLWNEPRARALIIGGRAFETKALKQRAHELDLNGSVMWRGRQGANATADDLSAADILVIPDTVTEATASPLKMFEYLALGRAIVSVDRPALREILSEETAEFFRAGDAQDFARALRAVGESVERRKTMGLCGLERVREFTYTRRAEKIIQACTIVDGKASRA